MHNCSSTPLPLLYVLLYGCINRGPAASRPFICSGRGRPGCRARPNLKFTSQVEDTRTSAYIHFRDSFKIINMRTNNLEHIELQVLSYYIVKGRSTDSTRVLPSPKRTKQRGTKFLYLSYIVKGFRHRTTIPFDHTIVLQRFQTCAWRAPPARP